ncbi:MAG: hypothetical protein U1F27_01325 [Turneriella sp.]
MIAAFEELHAIFRAMMPWAELRFLAVLILSCSSTLANVAGDQTINLEGPWQLRLLQCLPAEIECQARLSARSRNHLGASEVTRAKTYAADSISVTVPHNLHSQFPWFYGEAEYRHDFNYSRGTAPREPNMIILGSIGSVDEVHFNGQLIGNDGIYEQGMVVSAWNKVRAYRLPSGILREGLNTISVRITVLDIKAGIHAGPLRLGNASEFTTEVFLLRLWREYIFTAAPILFIVILFGFLLTSPYWQRSAGNAWLIAAFVSYLVHSVYFVPIPVSFEYLSFLKLQWSGRIASAAFTTLYFLSNFGVQTKRSIFAWSFIGLFYILFAFWPGTLATFALVMQWQQWTFIGHVAVLWVYFRQMKKSAKRSIYNHFIAASIPVSVVYLSDASMFSYLTNAPWIYHYTSLFNAINFIDHFSFHLYSWRYKGRDIGRSEAEVRHLKEKIQMAHELHDVVGAELSQLVVLSDRNRAAGESGAMRQLASSTLEKIRNFAHILKGENPVDELPAILHKLADRLRSLKRYEVVLLENPADVFLRGRRLQNMLPPSTQRKSDLPVFSPFVRMQLERILSEWSSNVIRHARSAHKLSLGWQVRHRRLRIFFAQDAGAFSWKGKAKQGGLKSIERRAREIGAAVMCRPYDQGALCLLVLPMEVLVV